jgi:hypothetical protein
VELKAPGSGTIRSGRLIMHINKVHHVKTISRVANELGEDEDWLFEIAIDMEIEDGVIWVYDSSEDGEMAFTDFGVENLIDLIKIHKDDPAIRARRSR